MEEGPEPALQLLAVEGVEGPMARAAEAEARLSTAMPLALVATVPLAV